jgi:hypothetical protein
MFITLLPDPPRHFQKKVEKAALKTHQKNGLIQKLPGPGASMCDVMSDGHFFLRRFLVSAFARHASVHALDQHSLYVFGSVPSRALLTS